MKGNLSEKFQMQREATYACLGDFCKGLLFTYSVLFVDSRENAAKLIDSDISGAVRAIEETPDLFRLDLELVAKYIALCPESAAAASFSQQGLLPPFNLIDLPNTYTEFHKKYYGKKCTIC